jgi:hypothetical protein
MAKDLSKIEKEHADFCVEVQGLKADELKQRLVSLQQGLKESEDHLEANDVVKSLKDQLKEILGPYRDVRKAVKDKTAYILHLLEGQGQ